MTCSWIYVSDFKKNTQTPITSLFDNVQQRVRTEIRVDTESRFIIQRLKEIESYSAFAKNVKSKIPIFLL